MSPKSFLTVQKLAGLLELGDLLFITDITSKNWYEQISSLWPGKTISPFHCILHASDFPQFTAGLKQFKTPFYNLNNIFVAL